MEQYSEGKINKSEPKPGNGNVNTVYFIIQARGNTRISRTVFVYNERALTYISASCFENVRKKYTFTNSILRLHVNSTT